MLALARTLACVDIEATGPQPEADRAVEVAVVRLAPDGTRTALRWLINPERPIPADATAVHHITDEQVARAPTFAELAHEIAAALRDCDLCGYNLRAFDLPMLRAEFARARVEWTFNGAVVDAYVIFRERGRRRRRAAGPGPRRRRRLRARARGAAGRPRLTLLRGGR